MFPAQSFDPIAYRTTFGALMLDPYSSHFRFAVSVHDEAESPECAQYAGTAPFARAHCPSHESMTGRVAPTPAAVDDP
jgi:hypothetical protein